MGIVSEVLSADGSDIKSDRGSGDNVTAQHFTAPGDDSRPLPGDYAALSGAAGTGTQTATGYHDAKNPPKASPGEKRIYARDGGGAVVAEMWLKASGDVVISNGPGVFTMSADGSVNINGLVISPDGEITNKKGISLSDHKHPQEKDSGGNTEQDTGAAKK